jgi:hypothetical protein
MWWVTSSWDYILYTGDLGYAPLLPEADQGAGLLVRSLTDSNGPLAKGRNGTGSHGDYAFPPRTGEVTYYNALYVRALNAAAGLARATGHRGDGDRWARRGRALIGLRVGGMPGRIH